MIKAKFAVLYYIKKSKAKKKSSYSQEEFKKKNM